MSGCAHMNPNETCASCAPAKLREARQEIERLTYIVNDRQNCKNEWQERCAKTEAEIGRLRVESLSGYPPYYLFWLESQARLTEAIARAEKAEAALRAWRQGERGYQCSACYILDAALRDTAPAEVPLDSPDSVPPGVEALRARHYERINRVSQDAIKRARVGDTAPAEEGKL
jgi:hypothetical protein